MRDWQPIDTAPKKGPILVARGDLIWIAHHPHMSRAQPNPPTHWMPLPDPPKVIEVERIPVSDDQSQAIPEALHQGKKMAQ